MNNNPTAPYIHTKRTGNERVADWAIALLPVLIWSMFMFGGRVGMLCFIGAAFAIGLDYPVRRFILKQDGILCFDFMSGIYGILAVFTMPVTVPLFAPVVSSALVVIAKNIKVINGKRLFNPFIFSAGVMNMLFPKMMTAFTRPFAYFSAFDLVIDPKLMEHYRVISPLQYMADGSVYEDGVFAQLYGFASGNMGEIAVAAILLGTIYLAFRKEASLYSTIAVIFPILLLSLAFPSEDAESNYYAYSLILSGAIVFISTFGVNEKHTVPLTNSGRMIFCVLCGVLMFAGRKAFGGMECGYVVLLFLNLLSPLIETVTKPNFFKKAQKDKSGKKQ